MTTESDEGPTFIITPEAQAGIDRIAAEDPEAGAAFREMFANMRQAMRAVKDGRYGNFGEAMEAITGFRPERVDLDDDDDPDAEGG